MNYSVLEKNGKTVVKVSGKLSSAAVLSSGTFIRSLIERCGSNITLDIDGLEDEREMIYHVALINSFKKAVESKGGVFILISNRSVFKGYLSKTGLGRLFPVVSHNTPQEAR